MVRGHLPGIDFLWAAVIHGMRPPPTFSQLQILEVPMSWASLAAGQQELSPSLQMTAQDLGEGEEE